MHIKVQYVSNPHPPLQHIVIDVSPCHCSANLAPLLYLARYLYQETWTIGCCHNWLTQNAISLHVTLNLTAVFHLVQQISNDFLASHQTDSYSLQISIGFFVFQQTGSWLSPLTLNDSCSYQQTSSGSCAYHENLMEFFVSQTLNLASVYPKNVIETVACKICHESVIVFCTFPLTQSDPDETLNKRSVYY